MSEQITDIQEDIARYEAKLQSVKDNLNLIRQEKQSAERDTERSKTIQAEQAGLVAELTEQKQNLEAQLHALRYDFDTITNKVNDMKTEETALTTHHNEKISQLKAEIEAMNTKFRETEESLKSEIIKLNSEIDTKRAIVAELTNKEDDFNSRRSIAEDNAEIAEQKLSRVNIDLLSAESALANAKKSHAEEVATLKQEKTELETSVATAKSELEALNTQSEAKKEEIAGLVNSATQLSERERAVEVKENDLRQKYAKVGLPFPE